MIKIIHIASWLAGRRFYLFPKRLYQGHPLRREPAVWRGWHVLSPAHNPMCRLPHAMLAAVDGRRICARVLIGESRQCGIGYFALFDAENNQIAVQHLMDEAIRWMKQRGIHEMIGPVAPTPIDLGGGVLCEGFDEAAAFNDVYNFPYYDECIRNCGFEIDSEWLSYRVSRERFREERYHRTAVWAEERFGYYVRNDLTSSPRELAKAVFEIMNGEITQEDTNRLIGSLLRYIAHGLCPVVYAEEKAVGFLLTIRNDQKIPRITSMWVHDEWRRKGVTAVLFDEFVKGMERLNLRQADASAIHADNIASRISIESAGGIPIHRYRIYKRNI